MRDSGNVKRDTGFDTNTVRDSGKRNIISGFGFGRYLVSGIHRNLGSGYGIGKENGIRDRDDRSSGFEIVMKKK